MTSSRGPWSGWRGIYRSGVDVTATLGYQQAISAGTGMVMTKLQPGPRPPLPAWPLAT